MCRISNSDSRKAALTLILIINDSGFLDAHIKEAGLRDAGSPRFQALDKVHKPTGEAFSRRDMLETVKARCRPLDCRNNSAITPSVERT